MNGWLVLVGLLILWLISVLHGAFVPPPKPKPPPIPRAFPPPKKTLRVVAGRPVTMSVTKEPDIEMNLDFSQLPPTVDSIHSETEKD